MSPAAKKKVNAPAIRVRAKGKIARLMDDLAKLYKESHEGMDCRWVYDPLHRPDLANVITRRAQGYTGVFVKDIPGVDDLRLGNADDVVRVGDSILMAIEEELREEFKAELHQDALDQAKRVQHSFYEAQRQLEASKSGKTYRSEARGTVSIEERELEYDIEQRTSEEEEG